MVSARSSSLGGILPLGISSAFTTIRTSWMDMALPSVTTDVTVVLLGDEGSGSQERVSTTWCDEWSECAQRENERIRRFWNSLAKRDPYARVGPVRRSVVR